MEDTTWKGNWKSYVKLFLFVLGLRDIPSKRKDPNEKGID